MLFSIIIPTFNPGNRIHDCLKSILRQTFTDFEVIIINDGCTDGSENIIKSYADKDSRIKLFNFPNAGVGIARRRGILLSSGEYLFFVDSDDVIAPLLLEIVHNIICKYHDVEIIRHQCKLINDCTFKNPERYNYLEKTEQMMTGAEALREWSVPHRKYGVYWLFIFKSNIFKNHDWQYPDIRCHEDLALIPLLVASAQYVYVTSYIGYYQYQNNPTSITNSEKELDMLRDFFITYDYAISNFYNLKLPKADIQFLVNDYKRRLISKMDSISEGEKTEAFFSELAKRLED